MYHFLKPAKCRSIFEDYGMSIQMHVLKTQAASAH